MVGLPYRIVMPRGKRRPVLLSCPHVGTEIPRDIQVHMRPSVASAVADTDWLVHELYEFATDLGVTMIHARFSRYVIDLNRDPTGQALYADGRAESTLVPLKTFAQEKIYCGLEPDAAEVSRRRKVYFDPYHARVNDELQAMRQTFRNVLFVDAHSIRRMVPSIRPEPFADLIVGDQRNKTAASSLSESAIATLRAGGYEVQHNTPFMGGYLTRHFGKPHIGQHALQLEMAQDIYLEDDHVALSIAKCSRLRPVLRKVLDELARAVEDMT